MKKPSEIAKQYARLPRNPEMYSPIELVRYGYERGLVLGMRLAKREQPKKLQTG